jgi:hypothetical protein
VDNPRKARALQCHRAHAARERVHPAAWSIVWCFACVPHRLVLSTRAGPAHETPLVMADTLLKLANTDLPIMVRQWGGRCARAKSPAGRVAAVPLMVVGIRLFAGQRG